MLERQCLAITLINPAKPEEAGSYLWCVHREHASGMHTSYCGMWWLTSSESLVKPTPNMILWRTGSAEVVKAVSGKMLG